MEIVCPWCKKEQLFDFWAAEDNPGEEGVFLDACAFCEKEFKITYGKKEIKDVKRNK